MTPTEIKAQARNAANLGMYKKWHGDVPPMASVIQAMYYGPMGLRVRTLDQVRGWGHQDIVAAVKGLPGRFRSWEKRPCVEKYVALDYCNYLLVQQYRERKGLFKDE